MRIATTVALSLALTSLLTAQDPPKRPQTYDESADANQLFAEACAKAQRDNKRVLLMFGGNWCGWCHKLHDLFERDRAIATVLRNEYEIVLVDIGRGDKHTDLTAKVEAPHKENGYPFLTVTDAQGKPVTQQETGALEDGPNHDPAKVLAFLEKWKPAPLDARQVLADGKAAAKESGRTLFVHLGAPWCGWCHRLEDFLAEPKVAAIVAKDFVDLKIDQDRMTNGKEVAAELREGARGGIPWSVLLGPDGERRITSDSPGGNIGYPVQPEEIAHFMKMVETVRESMTDEDIAYLKQRLDERAAEILDARKKAAEERAKREAETAAKKGAVGGG